MPVRAEAQDLRQHAREAGDLVHGRRAVHAMHHADHVMVDQVRADARQIVHHRNAERLQVRRRPDAGDLQDMRRVHRAARDDDLAVGAHLGEIAAAAEGDADAALALEQELAALRLGLDPEVRPAPCLAQEGLRRRAAEAAAPRHLRIADARALLAVEVGIERKARLLGRFDEAVGERQDGAVVLDLERAALAAHLGVAALHVVLGLLEVGQHVVVAPAAIAHLRPAVEVGRRAAHIEHAVDRARAAHDPAARPFHAALAGALLGLGREVPVDQRISDQRAHAGRNVDHRMPVARTGLEQDHRRARFRQTRRDHAAGRAGAHHHIIRPHGAALMAFSPDIARQPPSLSHTKQEH